MIDWRQRFKDANLQALQLEHEIARLRAGIEVFLADGAREPSYLENVLADLPDFRLHEACRALGHRPAPHHRLCDPDNVIGPVICLGCGHEGDVDVDDVYVDEAMEENKS